MVTHDRLLALIEYDETTGNLTWRKTGALAGYEDPRGYRIIRIDGRKYYAHRLVWFYTKGVWPSLIDHANRDTRDNRIEAIREASRAQNALNTKLYRNNTSGAKGVRKMGRRWAARIKIDYVDTHIGMFATKEEAIRAYEAERLKRMPGGV